MEEHRTWSLFSSHGSVLLVIAADATCSLRSLARDTKLSRSAVTRCVDDLIEACLVHRVVIGSHIHYLIDGTMPMRHHVEGEHTVSDLISGAGLGPVS